LNTLHERNNDILMGTSWGTKVLFIYWKLRRVSTGQ